MLFTKRSLNGRGGRAIFKAVGGPKKSNFKYRLYADGSIYDQELNRVVGYVVENLDEVYKMHGQTLQRHLKSLL